MKRSRNDDSSLELLLDTMCNSFGGVMFIAISLAVMVSLRSAVQKPVIDNTERLAQLRQELQMLRNELSRRTLEQRELARRTEEMSSDPRRRLLNEITFLEQKLKERTLEKQLVEKEHALARTELENARIETMKITAARQKEEEIRKKLEKRRTDKQRELDKLKSEGPSAAARKLVFNTLTESQKMPYFIVMSKDRVWPVGPEPAGGSLHPNPAVEGTRIGDRVICKLLPGKGIPVFSGKELSPEFNALLNGIPPDRGPKFILGKEEAACFHRLREALKNRKIFHGFTLKDSERDFVYQFTDKARYEY